MGERNIILTTRLHGYAATWLRDYVTTWLRGYVATWLRGYATTRLRGYAATRLCDYVTMRLCDYTAMRLCGYVTMWLCGYVTILQSDKVYYVNFCRAEDFADVIQMPGVNLTGSIIICRYGLIFRGNKVCLVYSIKALIPTSPCPLKYSQLSALSILRDDSRAIAILGEARSGARCSGCHSV